MILNLFYSFHLLIINHKYDIPDRYHNFDVIPITIKF